MNQKLIFSLLFFGFLINYHIHKFVTLGSYHKEPFGGNRVSDFLCMS